MRVFAVGIEHALDVTVQRFQDSDVRMHQRPAILRRHDQRGASACFRDCTGGNLQLPVAPRGGAF
jgi:hypothetical protein